MPDAPRAALTTSDRTDGRTGNGRTEKEQLRYNWRYA